MLETAHLEVPIKQNTPRSYKRLKIILISLCCFLLVLIVGFRYIGVLGGNVHTVVSGKVYRSATLTGNNYTGNTANWSGNGLDAVLKQKNIQTVINLRGGSISDDWYRLEVASCERDKVAHKDIALSARLLPPPDKMKDLLDTFDHARYPILIHCQGGSDRTGLASTIYENVYEHVPLDEAERTQLTWRYGHMPIGKTRAMDDFFDLYRKYSDGLSLRDWIAKRYAPLYQQADNK